VSTEDRRRAAKAALDHGNELFHSPSWRSSVQEYETALRLYTDLDDVGGQADVLCNLASVAWRRSDLDLALRETSEEGGSHLRPAGIVHTDEQHARFGHCSSSALASRWSP